MTRVYRPVGQAVSVANTDVTLYTVPALKNFVGSTLSICNRDKSGAVATYRIAVVPNGDTLADKHYLQHDEFINSRASKRFTLGMTLGPNDDVIVRSDGANLSFTLFGSEISA